METSNRYKRNEYVDGNTVRRIHEVPYREESYPVRRKPLSEEEFRELKRRKGHSSTQSTKSQVNPKIHAMDPISLLVLSAAIMVTLYICVSYLMVQSDITSMSKEAASIESQLVELKNDNNASLERINTSIDLSKIYKIATNELGMVHANKDQIIEYEGAKSNYVRKYADIPEVENKNLIDDLLK